MKNNILKCLRSIPLGWQRFKKLNNILQVGMLVFWSRSLYYELLILEIGNGNYFQKVLSFFLVHPRYFLFNFIEMTCLHLQT